MRASLPINHSSNSRFLPQQEFQSAIFFRLALSGLLGPLSGLAGAFSSKTNLCIESRLECGCKLCSEFRSPCHVCMPENNETATATPRPDLGSVMKACIHHSSDFRNKSSRVRGGQLLERKSRRCTHDDISYRPDLSQKYYAVRGLFGGCVYAAALAASCSSAPSHDIAAARRHRREAQWWLLPADILPA